MFTTVPVQVPPQPRTAYPIAPHAWVRIEDKFLVPIRHAPELLALLGSHLPRAAHEDENFTIVESIYLDSPDLEFLRDHVGGRDGRAKLRVRRYASSNGLPTGAAFLEAKIKTGCVSTKERFALDAASLAAIMSGSGLTPTASLRNVNPSITAADLERRIARVDRLRRWCVVPRATVRYRRTAFEAAGLRVTLDHALVVDATTSISRSIASAVRSQLAARPSQDHGEELAQQRAVILEVKHSGDRPTWIDAYATTIGVSATSFSKYCFAMQQLVTIQARRCM